MKMSPSRADARHWTERLEDRRSKKVVFLSHCLLNENTRYLGGACRQGCVEEIVQSCVERGVGMVQMPCPEQQAWGGVLKHRLLFFYGSKGTLRYRLRRIVLPVMLWYTRRIYRRLAQETANQIRDYQESGIAILGIIGVDGSPSCGVHKTLNMREALDKIGRLERDSATAREVNRIISGTVTAGQGMYIELLRQEVGKRGMNIPLTFHDLVDELEGRFSSASVQAIIGHDS